VICSLACVQQLNDILPIEAADIPHISAESRQVIFVITCFVIRWVHKCKVTAFRNAVTLQVTDTLRRYELNFNSVPHGVTISCEPYTVGFPVCYWSPSDVFAASSGFVHLYILRFKEREKERRWWQRQLYTSREVYSGSGLLADFDFQSVRGLYKNFTRMSPSEF